MEIVAFLATLVLLGFVARDAMGRAVKLRRDRRRAKYRNVPLPRLVIPTFPGADILPAGVNRDSSVMVADSVADTVAEAVAQTPPLTAPAPLMDNSTPERKSPPPPKPPRKRRRSPDGPGVERERELERWMEPSARQARAGTVLPDATTASRQPRNEDVQVLPGRLQVLSGDGAGNDLRLFSRVGEKPRIVVGRDAGPAHRYITLRSPTVSRRHARIEFIDGQWTITNLSHTNPVLVNDRALTDPSAARTLANGDRIELGEVALRFLAS